MHLVIHPKLHTDVGQPGTLLYRREPPRLTSSLRWLSIGHGVAFSRWRRHRGQDAFGDAEPPHLLRMPDHAWVPSCAPSFLRVWLAAISARCGSGGGPG